MLAGWQEEQLMTPDFSLSGGVALVTGAGSGIGRAIALGLADAGAYVGCVDRVPGNVEATAAQILAAGSRAVPVAADVTDPAALSAAVAQTESARRTEGRKSELVRSALISSTSSGSRAHSSTSRPSEATA